VTGSRVTIQLQGTRPVGAYRNDTVRHTENQLHRFREERDEIGEVYDRLKIKSQLDSDIRELFLVQKAKLDKANAKIVKTADTLRERKAHLARLERGVTKVMRDGSRNVE
jgi:hypothetical protein